jgi:thioredoxin-related protein
MKTLFVLVMTAGLLPVWAAAESFGIGDKAVYTDIKMSDVSGKQVTLAEAAGENGLLVIFSANTCPFVHQWESRYNDLKDFTEKHQVGMIVLNSNYRNREGVDSYREMQKRAREQNYQFLYVVDEESRIANAFGAQTTPHVFLFDKHMELVYKGAIDDHYKSAAEVKQPYAKDAVSRIAKGEKVAVQETPPVGCSIKRKLD